MVEPLKTTEEVAQYLRVTERTVRRLIERGELQAARVGRQYRIPESALLRYVRGTSTEPATT